MSSTPPPPLPAPPPLQTSSSLPLSTTNKKSQPIPWTQEETFQLILSYQEKWYSSKRRQLKADQWEEVAATVAARCGFDFNSPEAKSGTQCRHKMEKLRSRYRVEVHSAVVSTWPYFALMDSMERGGGGGPPVPISARPLSLVPRSDHNNGIAGLSTAAAAAAAGYEYYGEQDEEGEGADYEEAYNNNNNKSRSINRILRKPCIVNRFPGSGDGVGFLHQGGERRKRLQEEEEEEEERKEEGGFGLVDEIKTFIEKMQGVERKKMEMLKETERWRMEMEQKRIEMMLTSQRKILDMIAAASSDES